ncbi:MAG: cyclic nucleotide-binding domain-containing protein [Pseudomonadota bacterium]
MSDINMCAFAEKMGVSKKYKQGDVIFTRGDDGDCMFIVQSGSVELRVDDKLVDSCEQNDAIGYMSLIDGSVRSSTATASSDTEVSILNERHFRYMVDEVPNFAMYLMETMAQRIRGMARALD